jgi:drug/metabolite transporter (DMT)-like permease
MRIGHAAVLTNHASRTFLLTMSGRHLAMLFLLAAIWGSSFMFIKVAVREIAPSTALLGRLGLAALALLAVSLFREPLRKTWNAFRAHAVPMLVVGIVNTALPVYLLFWAETRIDSGTAAIFQATAPLGSAVFAYFFVHAERVNGQRLVGLFLGLAGVGLLVGTLPSGDVIAGLAVVGSAMCYAAAGLYTGLKLSDVPILTIALGTLAVATLAVLPAGVVQAPGETPGWKPIVSVVVLGLVGTAFAYLLYYELVSGAGASRAILITYLVPPAALIYGVAFLGEELTVQAICALGLILGGVALGTSALAIRRRRQAAPLGDTAP